MDVDLYEAMKTLRAVRRLKPDPIPADVLARVLDAATWAPTGGNQQPWRIVLVASAESKARLGALYARSWERFSHGYGRMIARLPDAEQERQRRMVKAGDYLAAHFHQTPIVAVFCFDPRAMAITDAKLDRVSVVGGASVYPAVQNLLLACRAEGLGCVLTTLLCEHEAEVCDVLSIPAPWGTAAAVPIGYPVGRGHGPIRRRSAAEMVFRERFGEHGAKGRP
jgi:nitroreductase